MHTIEQYFNDLYRQDDPYGYRNRWYEERKRALLLAALPQRQFGAAWELGCSNGELTAALAERCETVLATDLSVRAVELARKRTAESGNVTVRQASHPSYWPSGQFDLIVFSELGYFLPLDALEECICRMGGSLTAHGVLVACHWQHGFAEALTTPAEVHPLLQATINLPQLFRYSDRDMLLEGWSEQDASVAAREGLA